MLEILKSKIEERFGELRWEEISSEEDLNLNLPDLIVCMGIKGGKELVLGFSKGLVLKRLLKRVKCDEALIGEREMISEVKSLTLEITRDLRDVVASHPVVVKGNFMELMVHKAKITACWGTIPEFGGIFLGIVEPQESFS